MGFLEDFALLPAPIKYVIGLGIFAGTAVTIPTPFGNFGIGKTILSPIIMAGFGAFGIYMSFETLYAVIFIILLLMFLLAFR